MKAKLLRKRDDARSISGPDDTNDVKIFRPTLLRRFGLFVLFAPLFPIYILLTWGVFEFLLAVRDLRSFGDFLEGLAIFLGIGWLMMCLVWRFSVVFVATSRSSIRFKSFFRDFTAPVSERLRFEFITTSGPIVMIFLKVWTPAGYFRLTNFEYSPDQLSEIEGFLLINKAKQKLGAATIK